MSRVIGLAMVSVMIGCGGGGLDRSECINHSDCKNDGVCFFATCVDSSFGISEVYLEMTPPPTSGLVPQPTPAPLSVASGYHTVSLQSTVRIAGAITQEGSGVSQTGSLRAVASSPIPGRTIAASTQITTSGFALDLLPGFAYVFQYDPGYTQSATQPPFTFAGNEGAGLLVTSGFIPSFTYPSNANMITVTGGLLWQNGGPALAGASVWATAGNVGSGPLLASTRVLTDANGDFSLTFPPGAGSVSIHVEQDPNNTGDTHVPTTTFSSVVSGGGSAGTLQLGADPTARTVDFLAVTDTGQPVPDATVFFDGLVGAGQLRQSGATGTDGSLQSDLLAGDYTVTIAPRRTVPFALTQTQTVVNGGGNALEVTLRRKVNIRGTIVSANGFAASNAVVTFRNRESSTLREFTTTTDAVGAYALAVDPGNPGEPLVYEMVVEPEVDSGFPRYRALREVSEAQEQTVNINLYPAALAYGQIVDPAGRGIPDVIVAFYSPELGPVGSAVLVGLVQTKANGEFVLPVPVPGG